LAVPPFYYYTAGDLNRVGEALEDGCGFDAPGSFAAWLSGKSTMYAYRMPGRRYDIGDMRSYEDVCSKFDRS
jgi:glucose-1-phosphate thymidylyltransferase